MKKILFVTSEMFPLIKTGGLGDFSASLPAALAAAGDDVVVLLPAYRALLENCGPTRELGCVTGFGIYHDIRLLEATDYQHHRVWLLDIPELFDRDGKPYTDPSGRDWQDNPRRFGIFCRAATEIALGHTGLDWQPEVVHCNDWQTGLIPGLLSLHSERPASVFTIHNLAYQGNFSPEVMNELLLPTDWWSIDGIEFHGGLSFMKAGIVFADRISTVSPSYANEILTEEQGCGMDGILRHRRNELSGIVNGIDTLLWNPETDDAITANYGVDTVVDKSLNKLAFQREHGLNTGKSKPLIGFVSRLAHQKGTDMLLTALKEFSHLDVQWAILGSGDVSVECELRNWQQRHSENVFCYVGYDESLAHQLIASADILLMPSVYEPCGLTQLYSLRYGTVPVVSATGGLADTVNDSNRESLKLGISSGFTFPRQDKAAMFQALRSAMGYFRNKKLWRQIQRCGMNQELGWTDTVGEYQHLYCLAEAKMRNEAPPLHAADQGRAKAERRTATNSEKGSLADLSGWDFISSNEALIFIQDPA